MKALNVIYIIRIALGALAALVSAFVVNLKVGNPLINGITIALAVYLLSYYLLKMQFMTRVEKPTKILSMGIGIYFMTFILCWVLFITPFLVPPTATFNFDPEEPKVGEIVTFMSTSEDPDGEIVSYSWNFGDETTGAGATSSHTYSNAGNYTVTLIVVDDHQISNAFSTTVTVLPPLS